jgi:hypothetical protein
MSQPADFLQGKMPPEETAIASYGYMKFLMGDAKRFDALLLALRENAKFDEAFLRSYGGVPELGAAAWMRKPVR